MGAIATAGSLSRPVAAREKLYAQFEGCLEVNPDLDRKLVSFQANRGLPFYRWLKYKEGFSARLVEYLIERLGPPRGLLLDPFAGTGTALFQAQAMGWDALGIELLPLGVFAIEARLAAQSVKPATFRAALEHIDGIRWEDHFDEGCRFPHVPITQGAFPPATERAIAGYRAVCSRLTRADVRKLFELAALAVLEEVSYTRKDGQYLRWDHRASKRGVKSSFHKGRIGSFDKAVRQKLQEILADLEGRHEERSLFESTVRATPPGTLDARKGSCLEILSQLPARHIDMVITSPPYCNRYDYTRTYALELAYLGIDEVGIKDLRQAMLSCTVENKAKRAELREAYARHGQAKAAAQVEDVFAAQDALHEVIAILRRLAREGLLNNANIPAMVQNYFYEMCFVLYEMARVVRPGGKIVMVNDNVRYAGEEVPVDMILSDMAGRFGMSTDCIWVLARGKGNSSQQMGNHGRHELRKCVYVWTKQ